MRRTTIMVQTLFLLCLGLAIRGVSGDNVQDDWIHPSLNDSVVDGEMLYVTWSSDFLSWFPTYCSECEITRVDLCLQPYSNRDFKIIIGKGLNIQTKQSYSWNISLSEEELRKSESFVLRVIPFDTDCNREGQEVTSSPFYIKAAPTSSASTTSSYVTTTSSLSSSDSSSSNSETLPSEIPVAVESSSSGGMSTGVKAGVGAGVGFAAVLLVAALLMFIKTKRSREHAKNWFGQRAIPEKEVTSDHLGPDQDGPHQDSGRKPVYETVSQANNHGGAFVAPQSHELDGRDLVLELDGERRH